MNCLPVIEMELRSASRRKATFLLRLMFAFAGLAVCLALLVGDDFNPKGKGPIMLRILSYSVLAFCIIAGGLATSDCVSVEKREGTLGLLFLTPLTGMDIVLGKMVFHTLHLGLGVCAVFPVFFLPLLVGGVTWGEVGRIVLALSLALLLSSSVGMLVSVMGTESRKTIMAAFWSVLLLTAAPMLYLLLRQLFLPMVAPRFGLPQLSPLFPVFSGFASFYALSYGARLYWGSILCLLGLSLALIWISGFLLTRVFLHGSEAKMRVKQRRNAAVDREMLERNPYEWIVSKDIGRGTAPGALLYLLILFFVAMLYVSLSTKNWQSGFSAAFFTALGIHLIVKLRYAVEATRQIHSDRQSGALELLLVTPIPSACVQIGHRKALRGAAAKLLVVLTGLNLALELAVVLFPKQLHMDIKITCIFSAFFIGGIAVAVADLAAIRWLALVHGLRATSHVKAAWRTFCSVMVIPWLAFGLVVLWLINTAPPERSVVTIISAWFVFGIILDALLIRHCREKLNRGLGHLINQT